MNFKEFFGNASWIMPDKECNTPYLRSTFRIGEVKKAEITICGLGFYYLYLNGKNVTEDLFVTLYTSYHIRRIIHNEEEEYRTICQKYDVSDFLQKGVNTIGIMLGGGYYRYPGTVYGRVKACWKLDVTTIDGSTLTFVSDGNAKWAPSFVIDEDTFTTGETHDYRLHKDNWNLPCFSDADWNSVELTEMPDTRYEYMFSPADRIAGRLKPRIIYSDSDKKIYDVGENITGWAYINVGKSTELIKVRFSEEIENGLLDDEKCYDQFFNIIPDGNERIVHPLFTWHGFRYVEVSGDAEMVDCAVIHANVPISTDFKSSNAVLNWIYKAYLRTQLNNMHSGIPTDCPTIERRAYTGDGQLCCEAAMLLLDSKSFYRKWINDITDAQDRITGHVPYTAPIIPSGGGPGGWGCAIVEVPYIYYRTYGETDVLSKNFDKMLRYFDYLNAHSEDNLVISDQPGVWCLGDWCTPEEVEIPEPYVNTYFYIKSVSRVIEIARIIGKEMVIPELEKKQFELKNAIISKFFDSKTGNFCGGVQGANAYALDIGLGDERTLKNMVAFYTDYGMFDTGIFGTDILLRVLFQSNNAELAYKLMSSEGEFSFGNWKNLGATTLWEYWTGERSHDHPMFGASVRYLFVYILGIKQAENTTGYKDIIIEPADISLENASGFIKTDSGCLKVSFTIINGKRVFEIDIPNGIKAVFKYNGISRSLNPRINVIES